MSQQMKLTSYFGKRKRILGDEPGIKSKRQLLDCDSTLNCKLGGNCRVNEEDRVQCGNEDVTTAFIDGTRIIDHTHEEKCCSEFEGLKTLNVKARDNSTRGNDVIDQANQSDDQKPQLSSVPVPFKLLGSLSPSKKSDQGSSTLESKSNNSVRPNVHKLLNTPTKKTLASCTHDILPDINDGSNSKCHTNDVIKSAKELVQRIKQSQKKVTADEKKKVKRELSLKEVKDKLKQSAKLNELRKSINKINEQAAILIELENKKKENSVPKLSKFKTIEVDIPLSPQKNALYSPSKVEKSPAKPAYERFNFLADAGTSLPLPFSFQKLYELFRAVDTISSMMINRGEDITFNKLKPAVQEMTRKSFTLRHLGQMAAVLPSAFTFRQEKVRNFGSNSKTDSYDLVIIPSFPQNPQGRLNTTNDKAEVFELPDRMSMTPKIIKARREAFYIALLDKTKDCHEEFLMSLDPPMQINRSDLKRWHPNFMVDHVPDIIPKELPQPPNSERPVTAKEVLERAKDFLSSNARLQKALESASQSSDLSRSITSNVSPAIKERVDNRLTNPLKGISKSLLERVRARQAAKALDSMRMTPQQEKETVMYTRLPTIARIVRTLFVNEQRGVLSWDTVLEKVQFSSNRSLCKGEIDEHVKLLVELLPEWLSVVHIRNSSYLKMNPDADLVSVMNKLTKIVMEKAKNS